MPKTLENSNTRLLISEVLRKVSNAKTKKEKVELLTKHNSVALRQLMIINFDELDIQKCHPVICHYFHCKSQYIWTKDLK